MSLTGLAEIVLEDKTLASAVEDARGGSVPALDLTAPGALRPFLVKGLVDAGRTVLAVAATAREAEDLVTYLGDLMDPAEVAYYPAWETLPHERLSPRSDTVGRRLAVLRRLRHPGQDRSNGPLKVVVAPVRSILQPQVKGLADLAPVELVPGAEADLDDVVRRLAAAAYSRVDLVEKRGEFAVRGGIVDVFPPTEEHPLRVEFWGDEVDEIRSFAVADQRSLEPAARLWAPPCRELLLTDEVRERARRLGEEHPELAELAEKLSEGHAVEGMESLAPVLVDEMEMLVDLMPTDSHVLVLDPERVRSRAHDLVATSEEFLHASWAAAASGGQAPIDLGAASYRSLGDVRALSLSQGKPWWSLSPFGLDTGADTGADGQPLRDELGEVVRADVDVAVGAVESRTVGIRPVSAYHGDVERAIGDLRAWLANGSRVVLVNEGHGPTQRMVEVLKEHDVPARLAETLSTPEEVAEGVVVVTTACLDHGFVDEELCLAVLTGEDLSGQRVSTKDMRRMPVRRKRQIDPLELQPGDYVVHDQHGVGRYVEMKQREVQGATREYLVLEYGAAKRGAAPDRLYVPADQLDQVTRYVGGEQPSLDRLGGSDWAKRKRRARKAVREIASELIKL
ncbi:MAG TPA: CarD family transcriptional regulator, partial [Nocardioidaceae bacterium]|nr:CarD family transcriptional regulator [Nocardioidaceae bacterium]